VRDWSKTTLSIVLDANGFHLFDNQIKTIVICKESDTINTENCIFEYIDFEGNIAIEVSKILHKHQVQSVIIEGGRQTLQTLLMLMFGTKHVF
jgi:diaminohydroxyphosphoribosylaminopyrimidine deaminase/5-amino-6-(5-phosphoribosylamino)uracil reductase